jgi:hypothetical protein
VGGVLATVCTRCGYRGRRCGLGMGLVAGWLRPRDAAQYFRTVPQVVYTLLLITFWSYARRCIATKLRRINPAQSPVYGA